MSNDKIIVNISIRDKRAYGDGTIFVCDNSDYVLHFDFDEQWDGVEAKTARIIYSGSKYIDIPFRGNQVKIERTPVSNRYSIGVYASNIKTSTPAFFDCDYSILSTNPFHAPIPEDTYNKIMALIEGADDAIVEVDELPTENIDPHILYNVNGKLFYRVGEEWAEIHSDFFNYVEKGDFEAAIQSISKSISYLNEKAELVDSNTEAIQGLESQAIQLKEDLKETDDKAVVAHNKAVEVNQLANNALSISSVALQGNQDEVKRATEAERHLGEKLDIVEGIAKGAGQSISFGDYQTMITSFNSLPKDAYNVNLNVMIIKRYVPDLWVSYKSDKNIPYEYTTDEDFVALLEQSGTVQVGYYIFSPLETQKVDIEGYPTNEQLDEKLKQYVKSTDYATSEKAGVVKVGSTTADPLYADENGDLHLGNDNALIDQRSGENAIRNQDLDHAIKVGLTGNQLLLTEDDKKKIIAWLGLEAGQSQLGFAQYAYNGGTYGDIPFPGIVSYSQVFGITAFNNTSWRNTLAISGAVPSIIDKKSDVYRPITVHYLDYAVFKALTDPKENSNFPTFWDADSRKLAQKTLGVGEWVEPDDSGYINLTESGVYEYFAIFYNSKYGETQYTNTFVYERSYYGNSAAEYTIQVNQSVGANYDFGSILVQFSGRNASMFASGNNNGGIRVFKARKIREI